MKKSFFLLFASIFLFLFMGLYGQNNNTISYNDLNRLTLITYANGNSNTFQYDAVGNRIVKTSSSNSLVSIKVFLEGPFQPANQIMHKQLHEGNIMPLHQPYNQSPWNYTGTETVIEIPANAVDWVLVELRQAASPELATQEAILPGWPKAMLLMQDGSIKDVAGETPKMGAAGGNDLYLVIRHRNHLDVMSSAPLTLAGSTYTYDFTDAVTKAYGGASGYKEIGTGIFGMVAGDIDADGAVFASDFNVWAINFGLITIYLPADVDMDGQVFASDFNKWAVNFGTNPESREVRFRSQVP